MRIVVLLALAAIACSSSEPITPAPEPSSPTLAAPADAIERGRDDFRQIARVLQHPRCRNCHPVGDAPLQGDLGKPHAMNITRRSASAGLPCTTCHRDKNSPLVKGPPGVPNWHMPPAEMPMVFEGLGVTKLCESLLDQTKNGGKTREALREHLAKDPLVLWGWNPGEGRTRPPISHVNFVRHVDGWLAAGAPCP
jgi:hypothetical protein